VEGLGCFTSGRYPLTRDEAGMLGYVQSDDENKWATDIGTALCNNKRKYFVSENPFSQNQICRKLPFTYLSHHYVERDAVPISVFHVLLGFTPAV
jgi:hypothetical protein